MEKEFQPAIDWLLEDDSPAIRAMTLRDIYGERDGSEIHQLKLRAHKQGPIAELLAHMQEEGYWAEPGHGYRPKYTGSVWAVITLAQMGAHIEYDERIETACEYMLAENLTPSGQFTITGAPSGTADCLQGNLAWALLELGVPFERLREAIDWMARTVTGDGIAPQGEKGAERRYYAGKYGPTFTCGANNKLPCAWGGTKVMLALSRAQQFESSSVIEEAIAHGLEFFLDDDPADAPYPNGWSENPSRNWWKFGFPVYYITDLLQVSEALVALGHGKDPRLYRTFELIQSKQDASGRWALEYDYSGKAWLDFGPKKKANKWVTLRALRVLRARA